MNWNHLHCFFEVAKAQSLKSAASTLQMAASTLSEQIKKLEDTLSKKLFIRSSKGLSLTNDGLILYEHAKIIFEEGSRILEKFSEDVVGGYPLKIGIEETISYDLAAEFASQYWDLYAPYGTMNTFKENDHELLIDNLILDNIDWGISSQRPKRKGLEYAKIGSFDIVFCCAKKLYQKFKNTKDLLTNIPFAENSWDKNMNKKIYQYLRENNVSPKEIIISDHSDFVKKLCSRGRCVMFIPENPLKKYPGLKLFSLEKPLTISLYAIWKGRDSDLIAIRKLKALINSKFSQLPERYEDINLQIEASDVSDDLLT